MWHFLEVQVYLIEVFLLPWKKNTNYVILSVGKLFNHLESLLPPSSIVVTAMTSSKPQQDRYESHQQENHKDIKTTIPSSLKMLGFAPITFRPFPPVRGFRESTWGKTRTRRWGFWDRRGYPNCLHIKLKFDTRSQSMTIWSPKNIPSWLSSLIRQDGFQEQLKYIPITVLTCSAHSPWTLHIQDHTYLIHELLNTTLIDWTDNPSTWNCHLPNLECKRTNFCTFVKFIP